MHGKFGISIEVKRASRMLMNLKNNSNLIGPCDRLLQEDITLLHKISWTFHETYQSNTIIVSKKEMNMNITQLFDKLVIQTQFFLDKNTAEKDKLCLI